MVIYAAELFYWQDQESFPFERAFLVTARTVAQWCTHYQAKLVIPTRNYAGAIEKRGTLPSESAERASFITELAQWIFANSEINELFCLFLDNQPIVPQANRVAKFDHHDDTCCWALNLTEIEYTILQHAWSENDLPTNLFYPQQETVCAPYPGSGLKAKVLRLLGAQRCYTPMQWQTRVSKK